MTRVQEVIEQIRALKMHPETCFGPMVRGGVYPFVGGGTVTETERREVLSALYRPAPVVDAMQEARFRVQRAHDAAVRSQ